MLPVRYILTSPCILMLHINACFDRCQYDLGSADGSLDKTVYLADETQAHSLSIGCDIDQNY